jgi:CO/xanthine dehydrogenase FAD-binding subunit
LRTSLPSYELIAPENLSAALEMLAQEPGVWKPFAGGTDLMVLLEAGKLPHRKFVNIWKLPELRPIEVSPESLAIGALSTYTEIQRNEILQCEFPLLCRAASETGGIATQNRGTLGGNIANASPAADSPPALLVYDAQIELISSKGTRRLPYRDFHTGYKKIQMRDDELIWRIHLSRALKQRKEYYRKVGTRRAQAISKICFAAAASVEKGRINDVKIALGSVAPTVLRATETEKTLYGEKLSSALLKSAQAILVREILPIDDMRSTAVYRRRVAQNLLAGFFDAMSS